MTFPSKSLLRFRLQWTFKYPRVCSEEITHSVLKDDDYGKHCFQIQGTTKLLSDLVSKAIRSSGSKTIRKKDNQYDGTYLLTRSHSYHHPPSIDLSGMSKNKRSIIPKPYLSLRVGSDTRRYQRAGDYVGTLRVKCCYWKL